MKQKSYWTKYKNIIETKGINMLAQSKVRDFQYYKKLQTIWTKEMRKIFDETSERMGARIG
jgi:hypothetical protein